MSLTSGQRVPSFTLKDQDDVDFLLDDALGKGPIVFFFYPKDETAGCTAEACSFRDANPALAAAGATVVGISRDSVASHKAWATKHNFPFKLLADVDGKVRDAFGVPKAAFGLFDGRVTYVVDKEGVIRHSFESLLRATKHVDEAIETVKKLAAKAA
jgi:peroxiredoxin Q/BCP